MNKLEQAWDYFINVFLGVDCEEEIDIENSKDPAMKELRESLQRVNQMEARMQQSHQIKGGKENGNSVVEKVEIDYKTIEEAAKRVEQKRVKTSEEREI